MMALVPDNFYYLRFCSDVILCLFSVEGGRSLTGRELALAARIPENLFKMAFQSEGRPFLAALFFSCRARKAHGTAR